MAKRNFFRPAAAEVTSEVKEIARDLIDFLKSKGHSEERAAQIAGNHPDAVRAEMEKEKEQPPANTDDTAEIPAEAPAEESDGNEAEKEEGEAQ